MTMTMTVSRHFSGGVFVGGRTRTLMDTKINKSQFHIASCKHFSNQQIPTREAMMANLVYRETSGEAIHKGSVCSLTATVSYPPSRSREQALCQERESRPGTASHTH